MDKQVRRTLAGVCLAGVFASPAAAITMQAVYTGTIVQSHFSGQGAFGVPDGGSVDGLSAEFVFVYDPFDAPTQVFREGFPGEFLRYAAGEWPEATAWVTINGVTEQIEPGPGNTGYASSAVTWEGSKIVHEVNETHSLNGLGETTLLADATSLGTVEFWQPLVGSIPLTALGTAERFGLGLFYSFQRYENMDVQHSWFVETRWQSVEVSPAAIAPVLAPPAWLLLASGLVAVSGVAGWARRAPPAGASAL